MNVANEWWVLPLVTEQDIRQAQGEWQEHKKEMENIKFNSILTPNNFKKYDIIDLERTCLKFLAEKRILENALEKLRSEYYALEAAFLKTRGLRDALKNKDKVIAELKAQKQAVVDKENSELLELEKDIQPFLIEKHLKGNTRLEGKPLSYIMDLIESIQETNDPHQGNAGHDY